MKDLFIIGSGGFGKQVIEIVELLNVTNKAYNFKGIIDDNIELIGQSVLGYKIIGDTDYLKTLSETNEVFAAIAIGDGIIREKISKKLSNVKWENLIHPNTIVSKHITFGVGNIVCGGAVINPDCKIGNHSNINIGTTLGHDVTIDDFATLMPGCRISGNVNVGKYSMVGTGSCILQGIKISKNSIIGAGAVVLNDIDPYSVMVGNPAKSQKKRGICELM